MSARDEAERRIVADPMRSWYPLAYPITEQEVEERRVIFVGGARWQAGQAAPVMDRKALEAAAMDAAWAQFARLPSSNPGQIVRAVFQAIGPMLRDAAEVRAEQRERDAQIAEFEFPVGTPRAMQVRIAAAIRGEKTDA